MADEPRSRAAKRAHERARRRRRRWWIAVAVVAAGAAALAVVLVVVPAKRSPSRPATGPTGPSGARHSGPTALCPLTGSPVPGGGQVPRRPALGVKVDNYTTARPQSGLAHADIVFEEPVEGGITRYVAVFQCQEATLVGDIRSARQLDIGILGEFGHPILAHVGGIEPVLDNIENSPLMNLTLGAHETIVQHPSNRVAPYDTYASTAAMWAQYPGTTTPPAAVFSFSTATPTGQGAVPVGTIHIPFSGSSNVVWKYDAALHAFQRYYGTTPDILATGAQDTAANVVVQMIDVSYGPWAENTEGGLEVQANLATSASGTAIVFRSGVEIPAKWSRETLAEPTKYVTDTGSPISMQPGQTWVELVPTSVTVTATPPAPSPATGPGPPHATHPKAKHEDAP